MGAGDKHAVALLIEKGVDVSAKNSTGLVSGLVPKTLLLLIESEVFGPPQMLTDLST
jgi:hypothetical protein